MVRAIDTPRPMRSGGNGQRGFDVLATVGTAGGKESFMEITS
jgi:hypothetical protein